MLKNIRKILITIVLTAIFVLLAGVVSAELTLVVSKLSTPEPNIGNEITLNAVIENTGTLSVSGINLVMRTDYVMICSKTGLTIPGKNKTTVSCLWNITSNVSCGENSIYINVNGGGQQSLSKSMIIDVKGKYYTMLLEPDALELDQEFKVIVKDESENGVEGAKISLFEVFSIPGGYENDVPVDIGEVYTQNGQAALTITNAGNYKITAEYEKEFYCKSVYREREVMNTFIVYGLKNAYSLDEYFNITVTDKDNSTIDIIIEFMGPVTREYYKENLPFNFRNKGFCQGTYDLLIKEETDVGVPERYQRINQTITLSAGIDIPTPPTTPPLNIEITPDVDTLKKGDKITIYVKSNGKGIDGAKVKISTAFSGIKDLTTSGGGKVDYTIEKNDFFSIHAEKEGYASADISFDLMEDKDNTTCDGANQCECGSTLTSPQRMWYDLSCNGTGIIFGNSGVTLDCAGHSINGSGSGSGIYLSYKSNNVIRNCVVANFTNGIYLFSSSNNNLLKNNTVNNNSNGIILLYSSSNNLINNTVKSNNYSGVYLSYSYENTLQGNEITGNLIGIKAENSDSSVNSNFVCDNIELDFNYSIGFSSSGTNNTCSKPGSWNDIGYIGCSWLCNNSEGEKNNCTCDSCAGCMEKLNDPSCSVIRLNSNIFYPDTCINDPQYFNNKVFDCQNNIISGNGWKGYGIVMDNKTNNTIRNCIITGFDKGIYMHSSSNIIIQGNNISYNNVGIESDSLSTITSILNILSNNIKDDYSTTCDRNKDKIVYHDWNDLMLSYKCFLGIEKCN